MLRNLIRGILNVIFAAAATWAANAIVEKLFGPEDSERA